MRYRVWVFREDNAVIEDSMNGGKIVVRVLGRNASAHAAGYAAIKNAAAERRERERK